MSKLKSIKAPKPKPTFEEVEAKSLTAKEQQKLSRSMILKWFKNRRYDKLKALQEEIVDKTEDEKGDLRELIIENTKKNLEKQKRVAAKEIIPGVEKFASAITGIDDESKSLVGVLKTYQAIQRREEVFFATLDSHVGKEKNKKLLRNIIKNNKHIAGLLKAINAANPKAMHDINLAINQGSYSKLKAAMVKGDSGISKKQVDYFFGVAMTTEFGKKEYTGSKTIDGWINAVGKARYIGHTFAMKKAAEDSGVSIYLVMKFGMQTMASLRAMDSNLQKHKNLLEGKKNITGKDHERIKFIEEINNMRKAFDKKVDNKGLETSFHDILESYLETKTKLTEQQKTDIKASAKFEDLKMFQIYDLVYADDKDRNRLMYHGLTRGAALGYQFYKNYKHENMRLRGALTKYHLRRAQNMSIWEFKSKAKDWKMQNILGDIEGLEKQLKRGEASAASGLLESSGKYKVDSSGKYVTTNELYDRDMIMKKFHILSDAASKAMTKKAKPVIDAGKVLQRGMRQFKDFKNISAQRLLRKYPETIKALGLTEKQLATFKGKDLIGIYGNKLVDLKTMQDVTRARFAGLADVIDETVDQPFQKKLTGQMSEADELKFRRQTKSQLDNISSTSKARKWAPRLILPAIIVGFQGYGLYQGTTKTNEVIWNVAEAGLGFVPVVGTVLDFKAAFAGTSLAGKKLNMKERALSFGFGMIGIVADATTVIGGAGLGLRATIGGMKGTRGAVRAAKAARASGHIGDLADAGHLAKPGLFGKIVGGVSGGLGKTQRLEKATKATIEAKALKEAAMIHDLERALGSGKRIKASELNKELELIKYAHKGNPKVMQQVKRLEKLREGLAPGASYMKMLEGTARVPGHELLKARGFFSRTAMKIKSAFLEVKAALLKIGVPADTLREYEKSFDVVKKLEKNHAAKWDEIKALASKRDLAETKLKKLKELKEGATKDQKAFLNIIEKERKLTRKKIVLEGERKAFAIENKALTPAYKLVAKHGSLKKTPKKELEMLLAKAERHGHKVDFKEFSKNYSKLADTKKQIKGVDKDLKGVTKRKSALDDKLETNNATWHKEVTESNNFIKDVDGKMEVAQAELKNVNSQLNAVSSKRFRLHQEMEMKAEGWIARSDNMRRVSRYMQYGGLAAGGIWFLSDWRADPVTQAKYAYKGAGYAVSGTGKALHTIYIENHAGKDGLDKLIADKVDILKRKKKIQGAMAEAQRKGQSKLEFMTENANDPTVKEMIRTQGLQGKILAMKQKIASRLPARREVVTGDAANKLRETISG